MKKPQAKKVNQVGSTLVPDGKGGYFSVSTRIYNEVSICSESELATYLLDNDFMIRTLAELIYKYRLSRSAS